MATFKAGQRVRIVRATPRAKASRLFLIGREATIIQIPSENRAYDCDILVDGERSEHPTGGYAAKFYCLAPLDPKADEFVEGLKKLAREPAPREDAGVPCWPTVAPTAIYNGMTLVCTKDGVFAYRDGEWTKVRPIAP